MNMIVKIPENLTCMVKIIENSLRSWFLTLILESIGNFKKYLDIDFFLVLTYCNFLNFILIEKYYEDN